MLTPVDLQAFMDDHGIKGEIIFLDDPTPTVETAASALGTTPDRIVKSVLFTIGTMNILAISRGTKFIEQRAIAARLGVGRKRVRLAKPEIVLEVTGYPVGTVPPFGHQDLLQVLIDPGVLEPESIFAGGGANNAMLQLYPKDILTITNAEIIDLHSKP